MQPECKPEPYECSGIGRRSVVASFDGGTVSSDADALRLKGTDEAVGVLRRGSTRCSSRRVAFPTVSELQAAAGLYRRPA